MRVLGIDPGTSCGWALWDSDVPPHYTSGVWDLKYDQHSGGGMRYVKLRRFLDNIISRGGRLDRVHFEIVRQNVATLAAHVYGGCLAVIGGWCEDCCTQHDVTPYQGFEVAAIKKTAVGKGRASKDEMLAAAKKKWPDQKWVTKGETAYDQADALWILECGLNEYGRS